MRDEVPSKPDVPKANGWNNDGWDEEFDVPEKPKPKKKLSPRGSIKKKTTIIKANKITNADAKTDEGVGDNTEDKSALQEGHPESDRGDEPMNDKENAIVNIPEPSTQSISTADVLPEPDQKTGLPDTHEVQQETNQVQSITKPDKESRSTNLKPDVQSKSKSPKVKKSKKLVEKPQIKSDQSEAPPDGPPPEVRPIQDSASIKESEMAISKLVEHSESLGNSFEILTNRLQSREEQLVKLSTSNADLLAQNDDLKSQLDFLNEKDQINSKELKNMKTLEKEHQVNISCPTHGFRKEFGILCKNLFPKLFSETSR